MVSSSDFAFWLDKGAFQSLLQSKDVPTQHKGKVYLLLDRRQKCDVRHSSAEGYIPQSARQWEERFCVIKANLLGYSPAEDSYFQGAYLLEDVNASVYTGKEAVVNGVISYLPKLSNGSHFYVIYVTNKTDSERRLNPLILLVTSPTAAESWRREILEANLQRSRTGFSALRQEVQKERSVSQRECHLAELLVTRQRQELEEMNMSRKELQLEIQRLKEKTRRLQTTGEVTEKVAAEYMDLKMSEISALQCKMAEGLHKHEILCQSVTELKEHASKQHHRIRNLENDKRRLETKYNDLLRDLEEAQDNPSRLALIVCRVRNTMQRLGAENAKVRAENLALIQRYHEVEDRFEEKFKLIRKVSEAGDVFDYLKKWLLCSESKILFYESGYKLDDQEKRALCKTIEDLQNEIRIAEAVARSCYITLRSMLLDEQLKAYTRTAALPTFYSYVKTALERLAWIFGETETTEPLQEQLALDRKTDEKLFRACVERMYPLGGLCGSSRYYLVKGVDVMKSVECMVPATSMAALRNDFTFLELEFRDLQASYKLALKNLYEYRLAINEFKEQESVRAIVESLKSQREPAKPRP